MLAIFSFTLFLSASLLFLVQPMVGKMILPTLGGTPAVWNTCMVFFQALLLGGYAYAHAATRVLGVRRQAGLHLLLLLAPLALTWSGWWPVLPIGMDLSGVPASADNPVFWLLGRLLLSVGLVFFVVSANAPIFQMWFGATGHSQARDPYFLYAASNAGSLLALLGYPLVVERLAAIPGQARFWYAGYGVLVVMALACAVFVWRAPVTSQPAEGQEQNNVPAPTWGRRLRWVALAFVPSSLMLGATTHITTDIAPVPLLWILPLAIYLLSFVLVFARRTLIPHRVVVRAFPFVVAPVALMTVQGVEAWGWWPVPAHLVLLFAIAMLCHGEMAADRPGARYLTGFYLAMSVGGAVGGFFNAVVAPLVFDTLVEYPLVMVAATVVMVRDRGVWTARRLSRDVVAGLAAGVLVAGLVALLRYGLRFSTPPLVLTVFGPAAICVALVWRKPASLRLAFALTAALLVVYYGGRIDTWRMLYEGRNFYSAKSVYAHPSGSFHEFAHGTTVHGDQWTDPRGQDTPLTYYHPSGPVGDVFKMFPVMRVPANVAVVGLGAGAMAAYAERGQVFDLYEIDPEVARIAEDPALFTYLARCRGECKVLLGDGRLTLANAPDQHYGLIFLDAFSSDAVPMHLLTAEAIALYAQKLSDHGMLVFNITNRYLDLAPLLAKQAEQAGMSCRVRRDEANVPGVSEFPLKKASRFLVMARHESELARLERFAGWEKVGVPKDFPVWTDQYSSIFSVIAW